MLRDSFSAIVQAVSYGRLVFVNLKKTVLYLLPAGSFSELMPVLLNVLFGLPQALSSIQMILICVVTDVLPAISLCFEKPEAGLLTRPPRNPKKDKLVNIKLLAQAYAFLGVLESFCAMSMAFWYLQRRGYRFSQLCAPPSSFQHGVDADLQMAIVRLTARRMGHRRLQQRRRRRSIRVRLLRDFDLVEDH